MTVESRLGRSNAVNGEDNAGNGAKSPIELLQSLDEVVSEGGDTVDAQLRSHSRTGLIIGMITGPALANMVSGMSADAYTGLSMNVIVASGMVGAVIDARRHSKGFKQKDELDPYADAIAEQTGEHIDLLQVTKTKKALVWYLDDPGHGEHDDTGSIDTRDLAERLERITTMARGVNAARLMVVGYDLEKHALAPPVKPRKFDGYLDATKDATRYSAFDKALVYKLDYAQASKWASQLQYEDLQRDQRTLERAITTLGKTSPKHSTVTMFNSGLDMTNSAQMKILSAKLRQGVGVYLNDTDVARSTSNPSARQKYHKFGQLQGSNGKDATIVWNTSTGHYGETESLLHFLGITYEELVQRLDSTQPSEARQAALAIGYIVAQRLAYPHKKGISSKSDIQLTPLQSRESLLSSVSRHPQSILKRCAQALLLATVVIPGANLLARQPMLYGKLDPPALTQLDNVTGGPGRAISRFIESTRAEQDPPLPETLSSQEGYGDFAQNIPNAPVWKLQSSGGTAVDGYWIQNINDEFVMPSGSLPYWRNSEYFTQESQRSDSTSNWYPSIADLPKNDSYIHVSGSVESYNDRISIPIKEHTILSAIDVTDQGDNPLPFSVIEQESGLPMIWLSSSPRHAVKVKYALMNEPTKEYRVTKQVWVEKQENDDKNTYATVNIGDVEPMWSRYGNGAQTPQARLQELQGRDYTVIPHIKGQGFASAESFLQELLREKKMNCNTANSALVLSEPAELNLATGYMNANDSNADVLSARERHAFGIDTTGIIKDATPTNINAKDSAYLSETPLENMVPDGSGVNTKIVSSQADKKIAQKALLGTLGLTGTILGGVVVSEFVRRRIRSRHRKQYQKLAPENRAAGYQALNFAFYAPLGHTYSVASTRQEPDLNSEQTKTLYAIAPTRQKSIKTRHELNKRAAFDPQFKVSSGDLKSARLLLKIARNLDL